MTANYTFKKKKRRRKQTHTHTHTLYGSRGNIFTFALSFTPSRRTKCDHKFSWSTTYQRCRHVIRIAIISRTSILKYLWVQARLAFVGGTKLISATKWVKIEGQACTFASHDLSIFVQNLQFSWAENIHVFSASVDCTFCWYLPCCDHYMKVIAVN